MVSKVLNRESDMHKYSIHENLNSLNGNLISQLYKRSENFTGYSK